MTKPTINIQSPNRTFFYKVLNQLAKKSDFDLKREFENICQKENFHSFSDPNFYQKLEFLYSNIQKDSKLNNLGHIFVNNFAKEVIQNQIQIEKIYPQFQANEIKEPVFIFGLPRTGSTFMFDLLGSTNEFRTLKNWETHHPATLGSDRFLKVDAWIRLFMQNRLVPEIRVIHEQNYDRHEECTKLLMNSLVAQIFPGLFHIPEYNEFLDTADFTQTYKLYAKQLKIRQDHGKTWLLKAPMHIQAADKLLDTFPDAKIINLNRDLDQVIGSTCSLCAAFRLLTTDELNGFDIGEQTKKSLNRDLTKANAVLANHPDQVINIHFKEYIQDPLGTIEDIYSFLGRELSSKTSQTIKDSIERLKPHKYGKHIYNNQDFFRNI